MIQWTIAEIFYFWCFEVVFHWRLSSFKGLTNIVWSYKREFKIWIWSNKRLLRYSILIFLGHLPLEAAFIYGIYKIGFCHISLSLKSKYNPISDCWAIWLLIFWGRLPLQVVFILRAYKIWFGHISLSLKFEYDPISGCWAIQLLIFWGCLPLKCWGRLPLEVVFISSIFDFDLVPWA